MKWITEVPIAPHLDLNYDDTILGIGSCFVEHMGRKLEEGKFSFQMNPFGILYNPLSIANCLERITHQTFFQEEELFQHHNIWHSWEHHGSWSSLNKNELLSSINTQIAAFHEYLKKTQYCVLTFGSAYVYEHIATTKLVANCHKIPAKEFVKIRLDIHTIKEKLSKTIEHIRVINPSIKFLLTVSPVRHIRDGILENQRSKAILLLATEQLCELPHVYYFPSYELMMDELRDYRFFNADLVHPNEIAVEYIWEKFQTFAISQKTKQEYSQVQKVVRGFQHKILHPNTPAHQKFLVAQIRAAQKTMQEVNVDFSKEIQVFKEELEERFG